MMFTAESWPIACKMNFGPRSEDGTPIELASAEVWEDQLHQVAELGFRHIDPMDDWIPVAHLDDAKYRMFKHLSLIHISEPTRLGMISYAVFCLKKKKQ